jgi:hypothetical protein
LYNIDIGRHTEKLNPNMDFFRWIIRRCGEKSAELYLILRLVSNGKNLGGIAQLNLYSFSLDRQKQSLQRIHSRESPCFVSAERLRTRTSKTTPSTHY